MLMSRRTKLDTITRYSYYLMLMDIILKFQLFTFLPKISLENAYPVVVFTY